MRASNGKIIHNVAQTKVLGVYLNPENNMLTQIVRSKTLAMMRLHQITPVIKAMKSMNERRIIIEAIVSSILKYCSALYVGQNEAIKRKFHTSLMSIYRAIYGEQTILTRCETICSKIGLPMPREVLARQVVNFIH